MATLPNLAYGSAVIVAITGISVIVTIAAELCITAVLLPLQFLQLALRLVQFRVDFIALLGILGTLMVAGELVDLRSEMRDLHASGETCIQVDGGWVVQNHLRTQRLPQGVHGLDRRV